MERKEAFFSTLRAALVYPIILMVVATGAVVFMVTFVLPKFVVIFEQNNVVLPLPTRMLLGIVEFMQSYWYTFPIGLAACVLIAYWQLKNERNLVLLDRFTLRIPVVGKLLKTIHGAIVLRSLGTLLESGVPMLETLTVVQEGCSNHTFKSAIEKVYSAVIRGDGFSNSFGGNTLFPPSIRQIVATGEAAGTLPLVMNRSAMRLESEADKQLKRISTLFEPIIIIVMGVVIRFIAISVLLPLFNLTSTLRGGA